VAAGRSSRPRGSKRLRVVPIVVANQGFGFSLDIGGCRIADAAFLELFFGTGSLNSGAAFDNRTGQMTSTSLTLYESEKQATDKFEGISPGRSFFIASQTASNGPQLLSELDWREYHCAMFHLKDVAGDERVIGQMLASA